MTDAAPKPRMGRIGYLNVLPIYHALESGELPHPYELVYGPPADLNNRMAAGEIIQEFVQIRHEIQHFQITFLHKGIEPGGLP